MKSKKKVLKIGLSPLEKHMDKQVMWCKKMFIDNDKQKPSKKKDNGTAQ